MSLASRHGEAKAEREDAHMVAPPQMLRLLQRIRSLGRRESDQEGHRVGPFNRSSSMRRIASWVLFCWVLGLCAYLGVFTLLVGAEFTDSSILDGYEPLIAFLVYALCVLAFLQFAAFWALRRATTAPDPFLVSVLSAIPLMSLVVAPVIVRQAAADLEARGQHTGVETIAIWAWVAPIVIYGAAWALLLATRLSGVSFLDEAIGVGAMLGGFLVPSILRLKIALALRQGLLAWDRDAAATAPRASFSAPAAG